MLKYPHLLKTNRQDGEEYYVFPKLDGSNCRISKNEFGCFKLRLISKGILIRYSTYIPVIT